MHKDCPMVIFDTA